MRRLALVWLLALATSLSLAGCALRHQDRVPAIGAFSTLPLLWRESETLGGLLDQSQSGHWAKAILAKAGSLTPLDVIDPKPGSLRLLVMAQPRPLSPQENVALDRWVRAGGRVLLFADPMLTEHSHFALGDKRRPQDVVLLSPILKRWGLELVFDEEQSEGARWIDWLGAKLPVNLPGAFVLTSANTGCMLQAGGVIARCKVGQGMVLAVADAAVLERGSPVSDAEMTSDQQAAERHGAVPLRQMLDETLRQ